MNPPNPHVTYFVRETSLHISTIRMPIEAALHHDPKQFLAQGYKVVDKEEYKRALKNNTKRWQYHRYL